MEQETEVQPKDESLTDADTNVLAPVETRKRKTVTIKSLVLRYLQNHPKDLNNFVKHFARENRELTWQMLEGRPTQDLTSKGEALLPRPLDDIHKVEEIANNLDKIG